MSLKLALRNVSHFTDPGSVPLAVNCAAAGIAADAAIIANRTLINARLITYIFYKDKKNAYF